MRGSSAEEVEQAKTDKYIVYRLHAALKQLKQCRSEDERVDYHTVLAAVAPERTAARDQSGMVRKVRALRTILFSDPLSQAGCAVHSGRVSVLTEPGMHGMRVVLVALPSHLERPRASGRPFPLERPREHPVLHSGSRL